jgi:hypothetical protein
MSVIAPTTFTTNVLICDDIFTGTVETVPTTVSCGIELQSTVSAFCMSRLTNAQLADPGFIPTNGMIVYNLSTNQFNMYQNGAFAIVNAAAGGTITGPGASTDTAIVRWSGVSGTVLEDSTVLVSNAGDITVVNSIQNDQGVATAPSYTFTGSIDTGMFQSSVGRLDFATGGARQVKIGNNPGAVNYVQLDGSLTTAPVGVSAQGTDANINLDLQPKGTGFVEVLTNGGDVGKIALYNAASTFYSAFQAGNPAANVTWTLPTVDATIPGQALTSNAAGILSWNSIGTQTATVVVTSAQLLALHATPVTIIPAAGAGTLISIVNATLEYNFNTTAYVVPGTSQLQLLINNLEVGTDIAATGLLDQAASTVASTTAANQSTGVAMATLSNNALVIQNSVGPEYTTGDGTLTVTVYYNIIPV